MPENGGEDVRKEQALYTAGGNISCCSHCGNLYRVFFKKKKATIFPSYATPRNKPKESKSMAYQRDTCTSMFILVLFTIA